MIPSAHSGMSINNTVSSQIMTSGSNEDTSHLEYLESEQKKLQDKVALLEKQGSYLAHNESAW
jgi:hypothetical protein